MINDLFINSPEQSENDGFVICINSEDEKEIIANCIKENDKANGFEIKDYHYLNNYGNNDYLFVSGVLLDLLKLHKRIYYNPNEKKWLRNNSEIPYIHLEFVERAHILLDEFKNPVLDENGNTLPDDFSINAGVKVPNENGCHILQFDYYWMKRYISFLQIIFDKNSEEVFFIPKDMLGVKEEYISKNELLKMAYELKSSGLLMRADDLFKYAKNVKDDSKVLCPFLCFLKDECKEEEIVWAFPDSERNAYYIPLKKSIYNTPAFAEHFDDRNSLIFEIYTNSLKMILAHEVAHVARGHWNLRINEPDYSKKRDVMMNCELNADWTGAYWLINELIYDTVTGNDYDPILAYKASDLIYLWAVRILSCYLSLSWAYRDNRKIDKDRILNFLNDENATHPIYEFRLYNLLGKLKEHLNHIGKTSGESENHLYTADGIIIDTKLTDEAWEKALGMIESFESSFDLTWNEKQDELHKNIGKNLSVEKIKIEDKNNMPFTVAKIKQAEEELEKYEECWRDVLPKLEKYGMFFTM